MVAIDLVLLEIDLENHFVFVAVERDPQHHHHDVEVMGMVAIGLVLLEIDLENHFVFVVAARDQVKHFVFFVTMEMEIGFVLAGKGQENQWLFELVMVMAMAIVNHVAVVVFVLERDREMDFLNDVMVNHVEIALVER